MVRLAAPILLVSTRRLFQRGDPGWESYVDFIGLPQLRKVITIDTSLNAYVDRCGDYIGELDDVPSLLEMVPRPKPPREFHLVAAAVGETEPPRPDGFELVGFDLSDETTTSSLLNCGPWQGDLEPLTERLDEDGLLTLADARLAQQLLPRVWGPVDPHAHVTIWALFVSPLPRAPDPTST